MKKVTNIFTIFFFSLYLTVFSTVIPSVHAAGESTNDIPLEGIYDLTSNKEQIFVLQDKTGEIVNITITPLDSYTRIANGSYRVKYQHANYWSGSFIVNISGNTITSANSPNVAPITGSIVRYNLVKNSSTKATLNVYWRSNLGGVPMLSGMKAYISGRDLKVSTL